MARTPPLPPASTVQAIREWFGCQPNAARLGAILFEADGAWINRGDLMSLTGQTSAALRASAQVLRETMDFGSIDRDDVLGLRMTITGLADCRAALADAERRGLDEQVAA